jgi:hypothetical protein
MRKSINLMPHFSQCAGDMPAGIGVMAGIAPQPGINIANPQHWP